MADAGKTGPPPTPAGLVEEETYYLVVTEKTESRLKQVHADATGEEPPRGSVTDRK